MRSKLIPPLLGYYTMAGGAAPVATPWYLAGGVASANCIAAYQPFGADDLADSYINIANPGTFNITETVSSPGWDATNGWTFVDNNDKRIDTGITPASGYSMIVRFTNASTTPISVAGYSKTGARFRLDPIDGENHNYGSGGASVVAGNVTAGVMAVAGQQGYLDGTADGDAISAWTDTASGTIYIGGCNGLTDRPFNGYVQAVAIYDTTLTVEQVAAIGAAVNDICLEEYVSGVWSWFTKPTYVTYNSNRYFTVLDSQAADLKIYKYDPTNYVLKSYTLDANYTGDDHALASILLRESDHKILAFGAKHNDSTITLWTSTNAEDVSAWGAGASLDASIGGGTYNYPIPIQLTGEASDPIYLFYTERGVGIKGEYYSISTDSGATWAAGVQLFANGAERPYFQIIGNGTDRIDFACTQGHPNEVAGCSIYHFYYTGGSYYQSDGTLIEGALPLETTDVTLVYDGSTTEAWVWDIAIDSNGYPVIVYATFPTPASDHRYRYARWNGTTWVDNEICTAGGPLYAAETYYSGGITIDKGNPSIVWCSRVVDSQWEIFKYVTKDNGATWSAGTALTSSSTNMNARPVCSGGTTGLEPIYWTGTYTAYDNSDTDVKFR